MSMTEQGLRSFVARGLAAQSAAESAIANSQSQIAEDCAARPRALNPTRFICRTEVRSFLLECAEANRSHKFSRVSEETLVEINEHVRALLIAKVRRLPSKGKTI